MRNHIHLGYGRFVHKHHIQHALHYGAGFHSMGGGTVALKKNINSFEPPRMGHGIRRTGKKSLKPLRFKF